MADQEIEGLAEHLREVFYTGRTLPAEWRRDQLLALRRFMFENEAELTVAIQSDLHKPEMEGKMMELGVVFEEIDYALDHLDAWMAPETVPVGMLNKFDGCHLRRDPLGVCLIIAPWNYPIQLTLGPMVGALAGGNCIVLKPSEVAPACEKILLERLPGYLDAETFRVITGAVPETTALLEQHWDHIFYTGSGFVGKIVMRAAANHLTPVTLELGGKSPCIIDGTANLKTSAKRIAWGRYLNSGQSCIAPDYVLIPEAHMSTFLGELKAAIVEMFGEDAQQSDSYARVINENHWKRLSSYLDGVDVYYGGASDKEDLYIDPTIVLNPPLDHPVMNEEIFGPILPVVACESVAEAIKFVNARPKPLALYLYSTDKAAQEAVLTQTSSGGASINECMMHFGIKTFPFGGVGASGMGGYHGQFSFDAFTHKKGCMVKGIGMEFLNDVRYPPYSDTKMSRIKWATGYPTSAAPKPKSPLSKLVMIAIAVVLFLLYVRFVAVVGDDPAADGLVGKAVRVLKGLVG